MRAKNNCKYFVHLHTWGKMKFTVYICQIGISSKLETKHVNSKRRKLVKQFYTPAMLKEREAMCNIVESSHKEVDSPALIDLMVFICLSTKQNNVMFCSSQV